MPRHTALKLVQRTLSAIDADNISTLGETPEASQVQEIMERVMEEFLERPWPFLRQKRNLEVTSTAHQMRVPTDVDTYSWIRYNEVFIPRIPYEDMVVRLEGRDTSMSNIDSYGAYNDRDPSYWASIDDETVVFDAYDGNLVSSLSEIDAYVEPTIPTTDVDIFDVPNRVFKWLEYRMLEIAFSELLGDMSNSLKNQRAARRSYMNLRRWARKLDERESFYGRSYERMIISGRNTIDPDTINEA